MDEYAYFSQVLIYPLMYASSYVCVRITFQSCGLCWYVTPLRQFVDTPRHALYASLALL
jgi:hypothetical protein